MLLCINVFQMSIKKLEGNHKAYLFPSARGDKYACGTLVFPFY